MKAIFFGDARRRLFGAYHPPTSHVRGAQAILLCNPGIHEYSATHWAYRRLAGQLTRAGNHVLRFDYFGSGDSDGLPEEQTFDGLISDTRLAAAELLDVSGARQLSIVGLRLGGTVALEACRRGVRAQTLVLWSPVVSGAAYVQELEDWDAVHNRKLLHFTRTLRPRSELLGFVFPSGTKAELRGLDALSGSAPLAEKAVILSGNETEELVQLRNQLSEAKLDVVFEKDTSESTQERSGKAVLSSDALTMIAKHLSRGGAP